jgi:hypothetical protein
MKTKYIEFIHKEIDGIISPSEKQELDAALKENPELQQLKQELKHTSEILKQVSPLEPSPNLKKKIINAIDFSRYSPRTESMDWLSKLTGWIWTPRFRLAYAALAGMVIGMIISLLLIRSPFSNQPIPISELYGTIGISDKNYKTLNEFTINLEGINGLVKLNSYRDMVWAELKLATNQPSEIHFNYTERRLSFKAWRPIDEGRLILETDKNLVKILSEKQCHCLVLFRKSTNNFYPLTLHIMQSGKTVFTKNFSEEE